tara:strand:+ start:129 stop:635 length:507 start_codon:yes stop_codon:yes gene_type:complete
MYYTYAYLREDGRPYYIGKGKGNRIHNTHTKFVKLPPRERRIYLKQNLSSDDAYRHEVYMISILGRKPDGMLINRTNGGIGGNGKTYQTPETRDKISKALTGNNNSPRQCTWQITFECGRIEIVKRLPIWAKERGYDRSGIHKVYRGVRNHHMDIVKVIKLVTPKPPL